MFEVVLRPVVALDAHWVFDSCQDSEIHRWTLVPRPYLRDHANDFCNGGGPPTTARWAIWDRDGTFRGLGVISVHRIENGVAELGYWVAPWARGHHVCAEAVEQVLLWCAARPEVSAVTAKVAVTNIASRKVVTRAGFIEAGPTEELLPDGEGKVAGIVFLRKLNDRG